MEKIFFIDIVPSFVYYTARMKLSDLIYANKLAKKYFVACLNKNKAAKKYVASRLDASTIKKYGIGYAPRGGLIDYLINHGVYLPTISAVGLIGHGEESTFEFFRKRIMIPIYTAGLLVGFGGRDITGKARSKYLNTKDTPLYTKNTTLYGLYPHVKYIDKVGFGILVEGYFDVLACAQNKIKNVFSTCGTSLTKNQAEVIKLFTDTVYIVYDGDDAGRKSAAKAKSVLKKSAVRARVVTLKNGLDPDEYLTKYGKKRFLKNIEGSR